MQLFSLDDAAVYTAVQGSIIIIYEQNGRLMAVCDFHYKSIIICSVVGTTKYVHVIIIIYNITVYSANSQYVIIGTEKQ